MWLRCFLCFSQLVSKMTTQMLKISDRCEGTLIVSVFLFGFGFFCPVLGVAKKMKYSGKISCCEQKASLKV